MDEATFQLLDQPLDPNRVKQREAGGTRKVSYIETWDAKRTANLIFGYGRWGYEILELADLGIEQTFRERNGQRQYGHRVAYRARVRVAVDGCKLVEDVGYGEDISYTSILQSHELAAKEAVSDALKRALVAFGDQFGLSLYDKDASKKAARAKRAASSTPSTAPQSAISKWIMKAARETDTPDELRYRLTRMYGGVTSSKNVPADKVDAVCAAMNWYHDHPESLSELEAWEKKHGIGAAV